VQAGLRRAVRVARLEFAEYGARVDPLADAHRRPHRLVARPQPAGMGDRHQRAAGQFTCEDDSSRSRCVYRLARRCGQVDTAMTALPVRRRGVEYPHNSRLRSQWPIQPPAVG
jgi:hypothetical protein